ncbi:aminoacyl-tRNA deacylase [Anaerolinea thermophila]|uniref:aminoacyl-tRNA deacylase n=1 Tax=Anaerolinea thermophila TaxID=167964 RepID=UPI0026EE5830|nr:aminoacyl-tRNA deacylase [Anaerolinea thermophila]
MPVVNNVTRMLDARKVPYQAFELPPEKLGAEETAHLLGVSPAIVFKTIVVRRLTPGAKPILAVIPGDSELDEKKLAALVGEKKVQVPTQREAEEMTGLQAGGISPLALINRGFQIWVDERATKLDFIHVSGGQRGLNIRLKPQDLIRLTQARIGDLSSAKASHTGED